MTMKPLLIAACLSLCSATGLAQKAKKSAPASAKPIVFAVLRDGASVEPIAHVNRGKLSAPVNGSDAPTAISSFTRSYYKPGTNYKLIFGSAPAGTIKVKSSDPKAECSKNLADVTTSAEKTPLKGLVM